VSGSRASRPGPPRWQLALLAVLITAQTAASGVTLVLLDDPARAGVSQGAAAGGDAAVPPAGAVGVPAQASAPAGTGDATGPAARAERAEQVRTLLARRSAALLARDRTRWAATLDPAGAAFRARQLAVFDNLAQVPLATWSYSLDPSREQPQSPSSLSRYRAPVWVPVVHLAHQLRGMDSEPVAQRQYLTFVQRGGRWYLGGDDDYEDAGLRTARGLWDFGPVEVVRGRRTLVLGHPGAGALLRSVAADVDAAEARVSAVWGSDWARRLVVLVPGTQAELGRLIQEGNDLSQIAAVATAERADPDGLSGPDAGAADTLAPDPAASGTPAAQNYAVGDRIIVNPANFAKLSRLGQQIVLTHETTHVATRRATGPAVPTWLAEGFADYVGYRDRGVSVTVAARELRRDLARGDVPAALPSTRDFRGTSTELSQAYQMAWLACRLIVARTSEADLVRFYRVLGASPAGAEPAQALDAAFASVLDSSTASFTAGWRAYLRDLQ